MTARTRKPSGGRVTPKGTQSVSTPRRRAAADRSTVAGLPPGTGHGGWGDRSHRAPAAPPVQRRTGNRGGR